MTRRLSTAAKRRVSSTTARETDDRATTDQSATVNDPFSMNYHVEWYDIDDRDVDRALSLLVALTNLL